MNSTCKVFSVNCEVIIIHQCGYRLVVISQRLRACASRVFKRFIANSLSMAVGTANSVSGISPPDLYWSAKERIGNW
ncbi:unnamed protein product [Cochlearia groenlandica]